VAQLLVLLLVSSFECYLLGQGVPVGDSQHLLQHPRILHGELSDQGRVPESLLEEHDDRFVINLWYDVPLVAKKLDKFLKGLSLLLYHTSQVPVDSWSHACGLEVANELPAQVIP
jgi:hypothetical protein